MFKKLLGAGWITLANALLCVLVAGIDVSTASAQSQIPVFSDIPYDSTLRPPVEAIYRAGITSGCASPPFQYCPGTAISRSQMAVFLVRAVHGADFVPNSSNSPNPYPGDVTTAHLFYNYIVQAYTDGMITACATGPTYFCPDSSLIRDTAAQFLMLGINGGSFVPPPPTLIFSDVPTTYPLASWIDALYNAGLTQGCLVNPLRYCPTDVITRGSMALLITRGFDMPPSVYLRQVVTVSGQPSSVQLEATTWDFDDAVTKVEFFDGAASLCVFNNPPASQTCAWTASSGTHNFTAKATDASGRTRVSAPVIVATTPNASPTVTLTAPASGTVLPALSTINLAATASDALGISRVEFLIGNDIFSPITTPPYAGSIPSVPPGIYSVVARAVNAVGLMKTSAATTVTVCGPPQVNLTPATGAFFASPASVPLAATVTVATGCGPVQQVEFLVNGSVVNTDMSSPFSYTWSVTTGGSYAVVARAYDVFNQPGDSATSTIVIGSAPTASVTSPTNGASGSGPYSAVIHGADADGNLSLIRTFVNGALVQTTAVSGSSANSTAYSIPSGTPGVFVVSGEVVDATGAVTKTAPVVVTVLVSNSLAVPNVNASVAGTLPGQISVGPTGAATYSVPIAVPPGTAGVAPELSLVYNSQGGDGPLGTGWSLGGLSRITRCAPDVAHDGVVGGAVTMNAAGANDKFCLDGQRLVLVAGTYGGDLSEYRTDVDTVSKVVAHQDYPPAQWIGVSSFKIFTKSGQILTYGVSGTDAHQGVVRQNFVASLPYAGDTAVEWHLYRVEDRSGNYFTVQYQFDNTSDALPQSVNYRPIQIDYTGNGSQAPYSSVVFGYQARPDSYRGFELGVRSDNKYLMSSITTMADGQTVNTYAINYTTSGQSGRSLLSSIQVFDAGGASLPAATFDWQQRATADNVFSPINFANGPVPNFNAQTPSGSLLRTDIFTGDFDGDGKTDFAQLTGTVWNFYIATGSGFTLKTLTTPAQLAGKRSKDVLMGDFNGDGRPDFALPPPTTTGTPWVVCLNQFSGTTPGYVCNSWNGSSAGPQVGDYIVGDFNGDGRDDVVMKNPGGQAYMCYSNSAAFSFTCVSDYQNWDQIFPTLVVEGERLFPVQGDFTGDGKTDIVSIQPQPAPDGTYVKVCRPGAAGFNCVLSAVVPSAQTARLQIPQFNGGSISSDVNGDGTADLVLSFVPDDLSVGANFPAWVCRGTGLPFKPDTVQLQTPLLDCSANPTSSTSVFDYTNMFVADFDGDGRADSLHYDYTAGSEGWRVCQIGSTGTASPPANSFGCAAWGTVPSPPSVTNLGPIYGDFNGDGKIDLAMYNIATGWSVALAGGAKKTDLLASVTDGYGATTQLAYEALTSASGVYTPDTGAVYPTRDVRDATYVTRTLKRDNGLSSGTLDTTFKYGGLKVDLAGRGSLGLRWREGLDAVSNITTRNEFGQAFPTIGLPTLVNETTQGGTLISNVVNTWSQVASYPGVSGVQLPYMSQSVAKLKELNGTATTTTTTTQSGVDGYGNAVTVTKSIFDAQAAETRTSTTTSTFVTNASTWLVGELTLATTVNTGPSGPSMQRQVSYAYDTLGRLTQQVIEPNNVALTVQTAYSRSLAQNIWGLVDKTTTTWTDPSGFTTSPRIEYVSAFESKGRFPLYTVDASGGARETDYDLRFGKVARKVDPNGITWQMGYDGFGRPNLELDADGTSTTWKYVGSSSPTCETNISPCPIVKSAVVTVKKLNSAQITTPVATYLDRLGRSAVVHSFAFDGTGTRSYKIYDNKARLSKQSRTIKAGVAADSSALATYLYDDLGRVTTKQYQNKSGTTVSETSTYNGSISTSADALGHPRTEQRNGIGKTIKVTDAYAQNVLYAYDAFGNLTQTTLPDSNVISVTYDVAGRYRTSLNDPDLGARTFSVDPLGQMWKQVDAKNQTSLYQYDSLGRLVSRTIGGQQSTWTYDSCLVGFLCSATEGTYVRQQGYDSIGRLASTSTSIPTTANGVRTFYAANTYDKYGRLQSNQYQSPTGVLAAVGRGYNGQGYLNQVASQAGASWTVNSRNELDQLGQSTYGASLVSQRSYQSKTKRLTGIISGPGAGSSTVVNDSYDYDDAGNMTSRTQANATGGSVSETFTYDFLNRVASSSRLGSMAYNANGDLSLNGTINYSYNATCGTRTCPHAVSGVSGGLSTSFTYDANGNMTSGDAANVNWSAADMVTDINRAGYADYFTYGPEQQRVTRLAAGPAGTTLVTYGGGQEEEIANANAVSVKTYLPMGIGMLLDVPGAATQVRYFQQDILASTIAITDGTGTVLERLAYDTWGKRRNVNGNADPGNTLSAANDRYGYTGQEELDGTRFINMNGRMYNPVLGRFVSPDPTVSDAGNLQALNRYSYVLDNPFGYVDPSGFTPLHYQSSFIGFEDDNKPPPPPPDPCSPSSRICNTVHGVETVYARSWYLPALNGAGTGANEASDDDLPRGVWSGRNLAANPAPKKVVAPSLADDAISFVPVMGPFRDGYREARMGNYWTAAGYGLLGGTDLFGGWELRTVGKLVIRGAAGAVKQGTTVFRVFGGEARGLGRSWTTVNPGNVGDFRKASGLFPGNSGQFVVEGRLTNTEGVLFRDALPGPKGVGGGLPELVIPNPGSQVCIVCVSGVNPPF